MKDYFKSWGKSFHYTSLASAVAYLLNPSRWPAETEVMVSQLCLMCGSTSNCQTLCLGARPQYNLVVDEDVKEPTSQTNLNSPRIKKNNNKKTHTFKENVFFFFHLNEIINHVVLTCRSYPYLICDNSTAKQLKTWEHVLLSLDLKKTTKNTKRSSVKNYHTFCTSPLPFHLCMTLSVSL